MIDGIGKTAGGGRLELVRGSVERGEGLARAGDTLQRPAGSASSTIADMAASGPPVDAGKVAAIRAAIAEGRYPVDPDKIASSMLALDLPAKDQE